MQGSRMALIDGRVIQDVITNGCKQIRENTPEIRTCCYGFKEVNNQDVFVSRKHDKTPNLVCLPFHFTRREKKI